MFPDQLFNFAGQCAERWAFRRSALILSAFMSSCCFCEAGTFYYDGLLYCFLSNLSEVITIDYILFYMLDIQKKSAYTDF